MQTAKVHSFCFVSSSNGKHRYKTHLTTAVISLSYLTTNTFTIANENWKTFLINKAFMAAGVVQRFVLLKMRLIIFVFSIPISVAKLDFQDVVPSMGTDYVMYTSFPCYCCCCCCFQIGIHNSVRVYDAEFENGIECSQVQVLYW